MKNWWKWAFTPLANWPGRWRPIDITFGPLAIAVYGLIVWVFGNAA